MKARKKHNIVDQDKVPSFKFKAYSSTSSKVQTKIWRESILLKNTRNNSFQKVNSSTQKTSISLHKRIQNNYTILRHLTYSWLLVNC